MAGKTQKCRILVQNSTRVFVLIKHVVRTLHANVSSMQFPFLGPWSILRRMTSALDLRALDRTHPMICKIVSLDQKLFLNLLILTVVIVVLNRYSEHRKIIIQRGRRKKRRRRKKIIIQRGGGRGSKRGSSSNRNKWEHYLSGSCHHCYHEHCVFQSVSEVQWSKRFAGLT
jgi:hypothetical protein